MPSCCRDATDDLASRQGRLGPAVAQEAVLRDAPEPVFVSIRESLPAAHERGLGPRHGDFRIKGARQVGTTRDRRKPGP